METDDTIEEVNILAISDEILAKHPSKKTLIYGLHTLLCQFESHLDSIIKKFKTMTITILLATGAAVGFSFSAELKDLPINKLLMSGTISMLGMLGISAIWYLDIHVIHKFWGVFFIEKIKMEKKYSFLNDVENDFISLETIRSQLFGEGNFYISLNIILTIISGIAFSFIPKSNYIKITILILMVISSAYIARCMQKSSSRIYQVLKKMLNEKR